MKHGQVVTIPHDLSPDSYRAAIAYRAMLEYFSHVVALIELDSEEKARSFFGYPPKSALTILQCHGCGEQEADAVLNLTVRQQVNRVEYKTVEFHLTPAILAEMVDHGAGIFFNTACWSGKEAFARTILKAGYDCYIGPEKTSDLYSAFQFASAFLGNLLHEVRDFGAYEVATRQAFERAKALDDFWDGAAGFRLFDHDRPRHAGCDAS